jgi:hypothetical protein
LTFEHGFHENDDDDDDDDLSVILSAVADLPGENTTITSLNIRYIAIAGAMKENICLTSLALQGNQIQI